MTLARLKTALASSDGNARADAVRAFGETGFGVEAIPLLRKALADDYVSTVIHAAECVARLGPAALESPDAETPLPTGCRDETADLESQLMLTGARVWAYSGYANCYSACLDAMVKIGVAPDFVVEYVHDHIGLSNADDLIDSLTALRALGTPEAEDLCDRAVAFWRPELNKAQTKKVDALVAGTTRVKAKARAR
jgi:hypothetical protein